MPNSNSIAYPPHGRVLDILRLEKKREMPPGTPDSSS